MEASDWSPQNRTYVIWISSEPNDIWSEQLKFIDPSTGPRFETKIPFGTHVPVVVVQNTPPASPNEKAPTVEDLVAEATKENTEEEPKDKAPTVEDLEAEATEEHTEEEPKERPVLRNNWIREVAAQEIKTSKRKHDEENLSNLIPWW